MLTNRRITKILNLLFDSRLFIIALSYQNQIEILKKLNIQHLL